MFLRLIDTCLLATVVLLTAVDRAAAACAPATTEHRAVARVIDGETVALDDGREVRLAGILAPHILDAAADAESWPPAAKAHDALRALVSGKDVHLAAEDRRHDRNNRLRAHLFVVEGGSHRWVQGALLRQGEARVHARADETLCIAEMMSAEAQARQSALGLWTHGAYQVRPASDPFALRRLRGTFQVVEGRIHTIGRGRQRAYLNLGRDRKRGITAVLPLDIRGSKSITGIDLPNLKGAHVRVRGWIEVRRGPQLSITHPALIEILPEPPAVAPPLIHEPGTIEVKSGN